MTYPNPPGPTGPPGPPGPPEDVTPFPSCYRHPDRRAGVSCQRCDRPICPSCMTAASVGFQCPECLRAGSRAAPVYTTATLPGHRPYVTMLIIAMNVVAYIAQVATQPTDQFGNLHGVTLEGILYGPSVGADGEWWRLLTGGFLHANVIHIGMNMFVLYMIGPQLEQLLGRWRYAVLYVAALLAGALGVMVVSPQDPTYGASGAIFGLLGAAAGYQLSHHIDIWKSGLGRLIGINLFITFAFASFISVGGHVGGLIGGAAVGYSMFQIQERRLPEWVGLAVGTAFAVAFIVAAVVIAPTTEILQR